MTIAIGLHAIDGMVVAADTQETLGSYKSTESKLLIANHESEKTGAIVITGAGDAGYLDCINQEICALFVRRKSWDSFSFLRTLKKHVIEFHHNHVVPFAAFPYDERPSLGIIIGAQIQGRNCLWESEKSAVFGAKKYFAIGLGRAYAQMMLRRYWKQMDTVRAASLAAYILYHVKNTVDGCGHETQIVIIKDGRAKYVSQDNIDLLDYEFDQRAAVENQLVHFGIGCDLPGEDENNALARIGSMLLKERGDVIPLPKSESKPQKGKG